MRCYAQLRRGDSSTSFIIGRIDVERFRKQQKANERKRQFAAEILKNESQKSNIPTIVADGGTNGSTCITYAE